MPASIGVNLRVTGHCSQGGRRYMEDLFSVAYQQTEDERDLEYAFFGIYDGHGGGEAAAFAKEHLMDIIVKQRGFWSDNDDDVLRAIRNGYMLTHLNMWKELDKWPKTVAGLPSTAGTTASIAFIRRGKIYIGHVGDSAIVLGYQQEGEKEWKAKQLTLDHKPESTSEMDRIQQSGGKVVSKNGVPRVVWNRPRAGHTGPIKKSTPMDEIPFLAVARSLGDLWSYNMHTDEFIVSPDPDVGVLAIDTSKFRCLIFGTDGLWNMVSAEEAVLVVQATERHNEQAVVESDVDTQPRDWRNPSKRLVDCALERWSNTRMRADNTSVVTLMLDPPGPPRAAVLRSRSAVQRAAAPLAPQPPPASASAADDRPPVPNSGLTIVTRYTEEDKSTVPLPPCATIDGACPPRESPPLKTGVTYGDPANSCFIARLLSRKTVANALDSIFDAPERPSGPETTSEDSSADPAEDPSQEIDLSSRKPEQSDVESIQINEVSSSSPTEVPKARGRKPKEPTQACSDRALRSHDADAPQRPHTRLASNKTVAPSKIKSETAVLPEKVEILRRLPSEAAVAEPASAHPAAAEPRKVVRRAPEPKPALADPRIRREVTVRVTRSQDIHPHQPKIPRNPTQGVPAKDACPRPGNGARAPGPRRSASAARQERSETRDTRREHSKENARAGRSPPPAPTRRTRSAEPSDPEDQNQHQNPPRRTLLRKCRTEEPDAQVDSTTDPIEVRAPPKPRALRSRNDAEAPRKEILKRHARVEDHAPPTKVPKVTEKGYEKTRVAGRRSTWVPDLGLRKRLRKRLERATSEYTV